MRRTKRKIVGILSGLMVGCILAASAPVLAQGAPEPAKAIDLERARDLLGQGLKESAAGNYVTARSILLDAFKLSPSYDVAGTLAQVELKLERYRDAAEHLDLALRSFPPSESLKLKQQIEDALATAKQHVETVTLIVHPDGAAVRIDNAPVGTAPLAGDVFLEPGDHALEVRLNTHSSSARTIHAAAGHKQVVEIVLSQPETGTTEPSTPRSTGAGETHLSPPPLDTKSSHGGLQPKTLVLIGGGALTIALATVSVIEWRRGANAQDDVDTLRARAVSELGGNCQPHSSEPVCSELADAVDRRNSANRLVMPFAVGAAVTGVATVGVYFLVPDQKQSSMSQLRFFAAPQQAGVLYRTSF